MSNLTNYKPARFYFAKRDTRKQWYVYYYYRIPGTHDQFKEFRVLWNMNRIKSVTDRFYYGKKMEQFMNKKLGAGFNPFEKTNFKSTKQPAIKEQLDKIVAALTKKASQDKITSHNEQRNRFMKFVKAEGLENLSMHDFDTDLAKDYRTFLDEEMDLAVKTINQALSYLTNFWDYAIEENWCAVNPFKSIKRLDKTHKQSNEDEAERFDPLTTKEVDTIMKHLSATGERDYLRFLSMIFYAWARPKEITRLRVRDIVYWKPKAKQKARILYSVRVKLKTEVALTFRLYLP
jgi:hypothetical protein